MYHVELRKFPNSACAFNLTEAELRKITEPWSQDRWIELGERKWNPYEAKLIVLEGPHLPVEDLAMGRGWSNAQRHGEDVTERVLAQAREPRPSAGGAEGSTGSTGSPGAPVTRPGRGEAPAGETSADSIVPAGSAPSRSVEAEVEEEEEVEEAELPSLLGSDPGALLAAWRLAAERRPELSPSQSLALAERTLSAMGGSG